MISRVPHRLPATSAPFSLDIVTVGFDDDSNFDNEIFRSLAPTGRSQQRAI